MEGRIAGCHVSVMCHVPTQYLHPPLVPVSSSPDALSQMPVLGHRVEVRDASGAVHSIMFYPVAGSLDFTQVGHSWFTA